MDELERMLNETLYNAYSEKQPALVEEIRRLISRGQRPNQIEAFFGERCPVGSQTPTHMWHLARHILFLSATRSN